MSRRRTGPLITAFGLQYDQVTLHRPPGGRTADLQQPGWRPTCECSTSAPTSTASTPTSTTAPTTTVNYDRVLFSRGKDGANEVADLAKGELADVKVTIVGGALAGLTGMLVKVEELTDDASNVRLFHTSVTRANEPARLAGRARLHRRLRRVRRTDVPDVDGRRLRDLEAGIVSEETYVEQGLYWEKSHHPLLEYMIETYQPDLALVGYPVTDEFQHQFLGLVSPTVPDGSPTRPTTTCCSTEPGQAGRDSGGLHPPRLRGADATMRMARELLGKPKDVATFVGSDHGFARSSSPSTPARFSSTSASLDAADVELPPGHRRDHRQSQGVLGRRCRADLSERGRRNPAGGGLQQVAAADVANTVAQIKAAFLGVTDPNDWDGDGAAEGWKVIDRVFTQAEARYIPNGPGTTTDMAHPTRTGDLVVFSYPPYQFDAATPGTLIAKSEFFGQHGYVPDVQDLDDNVNMRATFLAGGNDIVKGSFAVRSIDLAPTIAYLMRIPEPQHSQGRVLREVLRGTGGVGR